MQSKKQQQRWQEVVNMPVVSFTCFLVCDASSRFRSRDLVFAAILVPFTKWFYVMVSAIYHRFDEVPGAIDVGFLRCPSVLRATF